MRICEGGISGTAASDGLRATFTRSSESLSYSTASNGGGAVGCSLVFGIPASL
jgi:hypothetical protein